MLLNAGVFAVFPISFFPLMLILHISYGSDILASSIKYYPDGLGALLVYTCAVHLLYPMLGSNWGGLTGFAFFVFIPIDLCTWRKAFS